MDREVWKRAAVVAWTAIVTACGALDGGRGDDSETKQFFENARRREATGIEREQVVRVQGCTAFFIENDSGVTTIGSARHCFDFSATSFCAAGGKFTTNDGQSGRCLEVIAGDAAHDIVVFKAEMPFKPRPEQTFRLGAFVPEVRTNLKMIGYPGDPDRKGQLTVTDRCWILKSDVPSPYLDGRTEDPSALHNCSTYGGNSGGPMMIDGTRIVVGLPFTYKPGDLSPSPADSLSTAAYMARMSDFVQRNRAALEAAGVVIAETPGETGTATSTATPDRDLFVALAARQDMPHAYVSARGAVAQVVVCEGALSAAACQAGSAGAVVATQDRASGERRLHATGALAAPAGATRTFTAVGRDGQGAVLSRVVFVVEPRS